MTTGPRRIGAAAADGNASAWLAGLGGIALLGYLAINILVPLVPQRLTDARAELIDRLPFWAALARLPLLAPRPGAPMAAAALAIVLVTLACYILAVWLSRRMPASQRNLTIVLGVTMLSCLASVLTLPTFSSDLYAYMAYERVFTVHHANPYTTPPATFSEDPYLRFADWTHTPMPYGPPWTYLSILWGGLTSYLIGDDVVHRLLVYRTVLFGFTLANVALLWLILGRVNPSYRLAGLIFYAWNPIVVLTGQKHTDTVVAFFLLLGVFLGTLNCSWLSLGAVTLSALTKPVTVPLLAVQLVGVWRRQSWRWALLGVGLVGGLALLLILPVWSGGEMLARALDDPNSFDRGYIFSSRRLIAFIAFLGVIAWVGWREDGMLHGMLRGWSIILLCFGYLVMSPQYAWYLISLIAVVSLVVAPGIVALTLSLCVGAALNYMLGAVASPPVALVGLLWWGPSVLVLLWLGRRSLGRLALGARRRAQALARMGRSG